DWLRRNARTLRQVRDAIARNGPMANADFEGRRAGGGAGWWNWKPVQHALHYLWMSGALAIHSRRHFHKRFDLLERAMPAAAAAARAARRPAPSQGTTLLSPFDSLLWYRDRVARLFGFDYRIQVYTPGPKRLHGYYTLPILHDGHLIGRVDAKAHRAEGRLDARGVHFEPWFAGGGTPPTGRDVVDRVAPRRSLARPDSPTDSYSAASTKSVAIARWPSWG